MTMMMIEAPHSNDQSNLNYVSEDHSPLIFNINIYIDIY